MSPGRHGDARRDEESGQSFNWFMINMINIFISPSPLESKFWESKELVCLIIFTGIPQHLEQCLACTTSPSLYIRMKFWTKNPRQSPSNCPIKPSWQLDFQKWLLLEIDFCLTMESFINHVQLHLLVSDCFEHGLRITVANLWSRIAEKAQESDSDWDKGHAGHSLPWTWQNWSSSEQNPAPNFLDPKPAYPLREGVRGEQKGARGKL